MESIRFYEFVTEAFRIRHYEIGIVNFYGGWWCVGNWSDALYQSPGKTPMGGDFTMTGKLPAAKMKKTGSINGPKPQTKKATMPKTKQTSKITKVK